MRYKLALLGFGSVGRELARLLMRKESELKERYDIAFSVTGIATGKHGSAINPNGLDILHAVETVEAGQTLDQFTNLPITDFRSTLPAAQRSPRWSRC